MKTILYNTDTNQIIGFFDPCYLVNGKPGLVEPPAIELLVVNTETPVCGPDEIAVSRFEVTEDRYLQVWSIIPKPTEPLQEFDLNQITMMLLRKVDGDVLTTEEEDLLAAYKTQNNG